MSGEHPPQKMGEPVATVLKAVIRYEGGPFAGWQVQPNRRTVQGDLAAVLSTIAGTPIQVYGASRTDAGVHALGQVCSFAWPAHRPYTMLRRSLSQMLRPLIRIESLEPAPPGFHARFSARGKRYGYSICLNRCPDPFVASYAWAIPWKVDMEYLDHLARTLLGEHDFAGFESAGSPAPHTVRTLHRMQVLRGGVIGPLDAQDVWRIEVTGDAFLYHMVRNLAGTLVDVARGYRPESWLAERLASKGPFRGLTAPAHGLALMQVYYDADEWGKAMAGQACGSLTSPGST